MREVFVTEKTVELAMQAAYEQAEAQGYAREEVSVTVEELPKRGLFKRTPAKVRLELPDLEQKAPKTQPAVKAEPAQKVEKPVAPAPQKPVEPRKPQEPKKQQEPKAQPEESAQPEEKTEQELQIEADPRLKAARDYLVQVFEKMGVTDTVITAHQQGEASILRVEGENVGALIGRRGETMEALSYLASLVANRQEGEYLKLGLDVAGYRSKREKDLQALARRIGAKVAKTGRSYAMEPMNPYERRIIHSTIGEMQGLRSESKGEGADRRVVVYSTDPSARNGRSNGRSGGRGPRREGGNYRGGNRDHSRGPRGGSVPGREFAQQPREPGAAPIAPKPTQHFNDAELFDNYGKVEL